MALQNKRLEPTMESESRILTINEFCRRNKVGRSTTYRLLAEGILAAVKIGRATRILPEQEDAFRKRLRSYETPRSREARD